MPEDNPEVNAEAADEGPWNVIPNRKMRRQALHEHGAEKPLRSRIRRK